MPIGIIFSIPLIMWLIQKATNTTGKKANYLRRRAFAWCLLLIFLLSLVSFIPICIGAIQAIPSDPSGIKLFKFAKFLAFNLVAYGAMFNFGFKKEEGENRGYFFSIWESYKPEYVVIKVNSKKDQQNQ